MNESNTNDISKGTERGFSHFTQKEREKTEGGGD